MWTTLAHQGNWDEILLVAGPVVLLFLMLALANRRADAMAAEDADPDHADPDHADPDHADPDHADPDHAPHAPHDGPPMTGR